MVSKPWFFTWGEGSRHSLQPTACTEASSQTRLVWVDMSDFSKAFPIGTWVLVHYFGRGLEHFHGLCSYKQGAGPSLYSLLWELLCKLPHHALFAVLLVSYTPQGHLNLRGCPRHVPSLINLPSLQGRPAVSWRVSMHFFGFSCLQESSSCISLVLSHSIYCCCFFVHCYWDQRDDVTKLMAIEMFISREIERLFYLS